MPELKLGCLPGYIPVGLNDLTFYCPGHLPKAPAKVDVPTVASQPDGTPWGMDGNDAYGDCGVAGINHGYMAVDAILNYPEASPSDDDIVQYYLTYTGGEDTGVVLADFLGYVKQQGFFGHAIKAYAPVNVHDVPTLTFAIDAFDFAYTGIVVTQAMQEAYANGQPWTLEDLDSPVDGGHCVPLVGYDSNYLYCITWGKVQPIAYPAWHSMSSEAWAVITGEFAAKNSDGRGINLAALEADLPKLAAA
jgi:hypothetical protein